MVTADWSAAMYSLGNFEDDMEGLDSQVLAYVLLRVCTSGGAKKSIEIEHKDVIYKG